jgi:ABC-2 type transport system permease protein
MSPIKTLATAQRVLKQLRHDPRTIALILFMPVILLTILRYVFDDKKMAFNNIAPILLGIFPLLIMFIVTSISTLRERTSGTLDRLMTEPISKLDIILGYALAFCTLGLFQSVIGVLLVLGLLDVHVQGGVLAMIVTAVLASSLGTALGLFASAFARNEFQAVQFVLPVVFPQVLLCGLFVARDQMARLLELISNVLPLTYAVDAMMQVAHNASWSSTLTKDLVIVLLFAIVALLLGSLTIRRQER